MLRRAQNPFRLAACPLAQALTEATGIPSAQSALRHAIEGAFGEDAQKWRLREMLLASIDGEPPRSQTARWLQVSKRHLQRRRAKAVAILADHVRRLVGAPVLAAEDETPKQGDDPLATLAALALRARADLGVEIGEESDELQRAILPELLAVLSAQTKEINGKRPSARESLWPLFERPRLSRAEDAEVRFELEWLAFLRARHSSDARQMDGVATNLKRIAGDRAVWVSRALLAQAEANLRCGRVAEASLLLDEAEARDLRSAALVQLARGSALRAELALQRGEDALAQRLASAGYLALRGRHLDAGVCRSTIARARLRLGEPWSDPGDCGTRGSTWNRIAFSIERARSMAGDGDGAGAKRRARDAFRAALDLHYDGLAARAAATFGAAFEAATPQRRDWELRAFAHLLGTRDRSVACDLFASEPDEMGRARSFAGDERLADVLYVELQRAIPQLRANSSIEAAAARSFLARLSCYTVAEGAFSELRKAVASLNVRACSFAQYLLHYMDDAGDILENGFGAIVSPRYRAETEERLTIALSCFASGVRPREELRRFLVG